MANTKTSKSQETYYAVYKSTSRWKTNRQKRLDRTKKLQPNNKNVDNAVVVYRRKTPKTKLWPKSAISLAKVFKMFLGRAPKEAFSTNPKIQSEALSTLRSKCSNTVNTSKVSFTLGSRAHDSRGNLVWG